MKLGLLLQRVRVSQCQSGSITELQGEVQQPDYCRRRCGKYPSPFALQNWILRGLICSRKLPRLKGRPESHPSSS